MKNRSSTSCGDPHLRCASRIIDAVNFAQSISKDGNRVYIELDPGSGERISEKWHSPLADIPLLVIPRHTAH